jgi:microcystin-dependent protein
MPARQYRSTVQAKTLSVGINDSITSMTLGPDTLTLPSAYPYTMVIDPDLASEEVVTVTASPTSGTFTIARGQDGTSRQAHTASAVVKHMITPRDLQDAQNHIEAASGGYTTTNDGVDAGVTGPTIAKSLHGIASGEGSVVGTLKTQTLTNKTLTSPTINGATLTGTVVLPSTTSIGTITSTELGYVDGVTSAIQTQLNTNTPVGSITMWALATAPTGWQICNGDAAATAALSTVLGTANVPDMRGFVPVGFKTSDDAFGTLKGTGGSKTSTATHTHNLASHTHGDDHVHSGSTGGQSANHYHNTPIGFENAPTDIAGSGSQLIDLATGGYAVSTGDNSGDHSHGFTTNSKNDHGYGTTTAGPSDNTSGGSSVGATNGNLQPYFTLNFIIKH